MVILIIIIVISVFMAFWTFGTNQEEMEKKKTQEIIERSRRQREAEEAEKMKKQIIQFANGHGVHLEYLFRQRENYYSQGLRSLSVSTIARPIEPTYTRGVVSGSLADNIATIANSQKKDVYEKEMKAIKENERLSIERFGLYSDCTQEIIAKLKQIPNSEKYVEYLEKNFENAMEPIKRIQKYMC